MVTSDVEIDAVSILEISKVVFCEVVVSPVSPVMVASGAITVTSLETIEAVVKVLSGLVAVLPISSAVRMR